MSRFLFLVLLAVAMLGCGTAPEGDVTTGGGMPIGDTAPPPGTGPVFTDPGTAPQEGR
jgi:hypothetical protein